MGVRSDEVPNGGKRVDLVDGDEALIPLLVMDMCMSVRESASLDILA